MRKTKAQKGITLIALIITIVVLLILATVAISSIINDGVLNYAGNAAIQYNQAVKNEQDTLQGYIDYLNKYSGGTGSGDNTGNVNGEIISKETDYSKCYADVDGNGTVDGIIFVDLAISKSGEWTDSDGVYSYEAKTNLNNYTIRDATTEEQGLFKGAIAKVISPIDKVEENDRFYVMALADLNPGTYYCWYAGAYGNMNDYATATSGEFGTGKVNTVTMIEKWNAESYGYKNTGDVADMWGAIQDKVTEGWFVPSRAEWSAFSDAFSIDSRNYREHGLGVYYWSSSQGDINSAWFVALDDAFMICREVNGDDIYVRLITTF